MSWKLSSTQQREVQIYFVGNMVDVGMSTEEKRHSE